MSLPIVLLFPHYVRGLYREGLQIHHWPPTGDRRYSIAVDTYSNIVLRDHATDRQSTLPMESSKLSWPVRDSIRFSKDGRYLLVPIEKTEFSIEHRTYRLNVWDLQKGRLVRTIRIDKDLLRSPPSEPATPLSSPRA